MKSLTIRELRQDWPEAEKTLRAEEEIIITRDGKPVAKLVCFQEPTSTKRSTACLVMFSPAWNV